MSVCYEDAICTLSDSCSICLLTWMGVTWREASEVTDLLLKSCAWSKVSQRHHQSSYWWTYLKWWPSQLAVNWLDSELKPILCVFQQKQVDMDHGLAGQLNNSCTNDQWWWIDYSNVAITAYDQLNLQYIKLTVNYSYISYLWCLCLRTVQHNQL